MEAVATALKVTLPKYLAELPVPQSLGGFLALTGAQWLQLIPVMLTFGFLLYSVVRLFHPVIEGARSGKHGPVINADIRKDSPKVVNLVDIEELDKEKTSYCRCWKSSKFPLCDGSHNEHNEKTGDNVGPLVLKKSMK